ARPPAQLGRGAHRPHRWRRVPGAPPERADRPGGPARRGARLRGPASVRIRPTTLRDVPAILDVVRAGHLALTGEPDWTVEEIVATLTAPNHDPERDSWLAVQPDGTVVAWAYLDNPGRGPRDSVEVHVVPGRGEPAQRPLLELAIARAAERGRAAGHAGVTLRAAAIASERAYLAALASTGFTFVRRHARMRRALDGTERPAAVAATVRALRPGDEPELRDFHRVLALCEQVPDDFDAWRA